MKTFYIIVAFCAGLFLGHQLFPTEQHLKPPSLAETQQTERMIAQIDTVKFTKENHFQKQSDSLVQELKKVNSLLIIHKGLLQSERNKVADLTHRLRSDTICKADSLLTDSLSTEIALLNNRTDAIISSYERKDSLLQSVVAIRDSAIVICNQSYQQLKDLLREQEKREQQLTDNLNTALKQLKQKRFQNRLLAAGMLFVSGIATTLIIKSRQ